jgi:hypothetical protein
VCALPAACRSHRWTLVSFHRGLAARHFAYCESERRNHVHRESSAARDRHRLHLAHRDRAHTSCVARVGFMSSDDLAVTTALRARQSHTVRRLEAALAAGGCAGRPVGAHRLCSDLSNSTSSATLE